MSLSIRVGTAGWSLPRDVQDAFPAERSYLARYAMRFPAVEINSSFHRPHRQATYARWAESTGPDFRFSVKLPKTITHERRLVACDDLLRRFADEVSGLGEKRGPILIQLPPSLAFDQSVADRFLHTLQAILPAQAVIEPRHPGWFDGRADALLAVHRIARVTADPAPVPEAALPGGWRGFTYIRLHGSPHMYRSDYEPDRIALHAEMAVRFASSGPVWVVYDNTTSGAATRNALALGQRLRDRGHCTN